LASVEESILIAASPEEVFDYVENPANFALYQGTVLHAGLEGDGPVRTGSRIRGASHILGRNVDWVAEVTVHQRPTKIALRTIQGKLPLTVCNTLAPEPGGTRLTYRAQADPQLDGFFGRLIEASAEQAYQQQVRADLAVLAEILARKEA
jgi:uncharacterized protein YndB with AHSA1/START domain